MPHNIVHFAIHADDVERARRFYEAVFGWRFEAWGPPGFYNITTGDADRPGIHGALHGRDEPLTGTGTRGFTGTVAVDDLAAIREKVVANGGTVTYAEIEIPTVGTLTQFLDTEGNELAAMVYAMDMFGAQMYPAITARLAERRRRGGRDRPQTVCEVSAALAVDASEADHYRQTTPAGTAKPQATEPV